MAFIATASAGVSRSDVHFNMGGSRIAYSINHRPNPHGGPNAFVSVSRTEPVHHHPVHISADQTPMHVPVDVAAHHVHDSAQQTPIHIPVHVAAPAHHVHDAAQQTPIHVPVHVTAPAHHVPAPIYPAATFHTPLVYSEPAFHTAMRHPKHYLDSYYPYYAYSRYYPHDGHPGFILVA